MTATFSYPELNDTLPALRRFAISLTRNEETAEDLVQDSIERAIQKSDLFEKGTNLRAWLFTICKRIFLNQVRAKQSRGFSVELDDVPESLTSVAPNQELSIECTELMKCYESLPVRDKLVLSLVVLEGLTYQETAFRLGIPVGTVRSRLSRARSHLRDLTENGFREE